VSLLSHSPGSRGWPYRSPAEDALPPTLPDGRAWPSISIVTPSFNQGEYIEDCLLSVLQQGYPVVEHIVMDAASPDRTGSVLDAYAPRLAHVTRAPDAGQSDAINKGMALASGDIVTWLNADDMLAPGALAAAALAFSSTGADMVAGGCTHLFDGRVGFHHLPGVAHGPLPLADILDVDGGWRTGRFFFQPEVLFTRTLWERVGGLRTDLHLAMDYELWLRFAHAGARLHTIGHPLAIYRRHAGQKTAVVEEGRHERPLAAEFCHCHGMAAPPAAADPRPWLGRNLRILTLHTAPPERRTFPLARLAEAMAEAWAEIIPMHLSDGSPARSVEGRIEVICQRIGWQSPDLVVVEDLRAWSGSAAMVASVAERWPTVVLTDGPGWPQDGQKDTGAHILDLTAGAVPPAVPRSLLLACGGERGDRTALHLPENAFIVAVTGTADCAGAAAALSAALDDHVCLMVDAPLAGAVVRPGVRVVDFDDPGRATVLAGMNVLVALDGGARSVQLLAEAAGVGALPLCLGPSALDALWPWPDDLRPPDTLADAAAVLVGLAGDRCRARHLSLHMARLAGNTVSTFSAWHGLFVLLRERGVLNAIGARDKIAFRPQPALLPQSLPAWPGL